MRIGKLDRGPYTLGVEIVRDAPKGRRRLRVLEDAAPHPVVVFLSEGAVGDAQLATWLDKLEARGAPVILCVDAPSETSPKATHPMAQRRISLLAIEQSAWVLAARDPRCVVVATRTELDFALKHGQISVWAPSKMVLDAIEGPSADMVAPSDLAQWLADEFDAVERLSVGLDDARFAPLTYT